MLRSAEAKPSISLKNKKKGKLRGKFKNRLKDKAYEEVTDYVAYIAKPKVLYSAA